MTVADPCATARFLGAFFDELAKWGVQNVVISPGSRSTPLSMTAYELSCRAPQLMSTLFPMVGWRLPWSLPVPPRVTP